MLRLIWISVAALIVAACGNGGVQSPDFTPELVSIRIEPTSASTPSVPVGRTLQFRAFGAYTLPPGSDRPEGLPADAVPTEEHEITGGVDWSVSNGSASISDSGVATGRAEGDTQVGASAHGVSADPVSLEVTAAVPESIRIVEDDQTIPVDGTFVFHAEATFSDGQTGPVTVLWEPASSTNTTLSPIESTSTTVTGVSSDAPGFTVITARFVQDGDLPDLTDTVRVDVRPLVTGLTIDPVNPSRPLGLKVDFSVTATCKTGPATTASCDPASAVAWSVANASSETNTTAVASIDAASGLANSLRVGNSVVTATADGVTATTNFTVTSPVLRRIEIVSPTADTQPLNSVSTPVGLGVGLKAIAVFTDDRRTPQRVIWSVVAPDLASFDPNPNAQTVARGEVLGDGTITASAVDAQDVAIEGVNDDGVPNGQAKDTVALTVTEATIDLSTFRVVPATDTVTVGRTRTFKAVVDTSDGLTVDLGSADVSWSSSNTAVAAVDDPAVGVVRGVAQDTSPVTITATGIGGRIPSGTTATASLRVTDNVCTTPLTTANANTSVFMTPTCLGCGVDDPNNILDADANTFANIHADLALLNGEVSLRATTTVFPPGELTAPARFAGGRNAGFIVARPVGQLVLAELFSQLQVRTLLGGVVQDVSGGPTPPPGALIPLPLRVDLLGASINGDYELALVSVDTVQDYDAIELGFNSGVATALSNVQVFQACGTANPPQSTTLQRIDGIQPSNATLVVGGKRDFVLMGTYEGSSTSSPIPDSDVVWESVTPGTVSVSSNGVVEGLAPGTGTVRATLKPGVPITGSSAPVTMSLTVVDDVCSSPLLTSGTPAASITSTINGICVLCNATNLPNVIDVPKENFATLNAPVALLNGGVSVIVNANRVVTPSTGNIAGFVISRPVSPLVQAEVLSQVLVETLNAQGAVVNTSGPVIPLRLGLLGAQLGGGEQLFVGLPTTAPFSQMRLTFNSGLLTADLDQLGNINVFRACAATSGVPAP